RSYSDGPQIEINIPVTKKLTLLIEMCSSSVPSGNVKQAQSQDLSSASVVMSRLAGHRKFTVILRPYEAEQFISLAVTMMWIFFEGGYPHKSV
ncbi:9232_t:CDS:2, partial [Ambispora gerdemannii]